jgi:hypothetical protein
MPSRSKRRILRYRKVAAALARFGVEILPASSGSHVKLRRGDNTTIIARHSDSQEYNAFVIAGVCRRLGIDEEDFWSKV